MKPVHICAAALAAASIALPAVAQYFSRQVQARQGHMQTQALSLGTIAGMARGQIAYDAAAATEAAGNLMAISGLSIAPFWPEGSDSARMDGTRALPTIWENNADFLAKWDAFGEAAASLAAVAGDGQEALGPALGALGQTCQACHESYQEPRG